MTRAEAEILIAKLDNLEARARDVVVGMTRIRHEFQDEFKIKTWNYDPRRIQHGVSCPKRPHRVGAAYMHGLDDDGPYDVDGVAYCGRCHECLPTQARQEPQP